MSLKELELRVQQLPRPELVKFSQWFDDFREITVLPADVPGEIEGAQQEEVLRRHAEYQANLAIATAWDDGFFDRLCQRLADAPAQKTTDH